MRDLVEFQNFNINEFECKCGCGRNLISIDFVEKLDMARSISGIPYRITSGYRCSKHNYDVGGALNSSHTKGLASDITFRYRKDFLHKILKGLFAVGFQRIIVYPKKGFVHVDDDLEKNHPLFLIEV